MSAVQWMPDSLPATLPQVLLVEDDRRLGELVQHYLGEHGFAVVPVHRGDLAVDACRRLSPQVVVLDLMLPGMGGIDVCRQIRAFSAVPILILTACEDDVDQVLGLESGADDYVLKPIEPRLLLARLRALLRRQQPVGGSRTKASFGGLCIDRAEREVTQAQQRIDLSTTEFEILWVLASQPGRSCRATRSCWRCAASASMDWTAAWTSASASCAASSATTRASHAASRPSGAAATSSTRPAGDPACSVCSCACG